MAAVEISDRLRRHFPEMAQVIESFNQLAEVNAVNMQTIATLRGLIDDWKTIAASREADIALLRARIAALTGKAA